MTRRCPVCTARLDRATGGIHPLCALNPPATAEEIRAAVMLLHRTLGAHPIRETKEDPR